MDDAASGDWRARLRPGARTLVVNKIMNTLKKHPVAGPDSLDELRKIAVRFEEKTFTAAVDQTDYLKRISMKMLTMESRKEGAGITNQMPSNAANQNPTDPVGSHVLQSQVRNTGQSLSIPLPNQSQAWQHGLAQGLQNNIVSVTVQGSATLASAVASMNGLNQSSMSSIGVNNSGQGIPQNIYASPQRQIQVRPQQQPIVYQKPHQRSSSSHLYTQQLHQHQQSLKAKLSHPSLLQSQVPQQQQQPLSSATQMQSSQRHLMQMSSSLQSSQSSLQAKQEQESDFSESEEEGQEQEQEVGGGEEEEMEEAEQEGEEGPQAGYSVREQLYSYGVRLDNLESGLGLLRADMNSIMAMMYSSHESMTLDNSSLSRQMERQMTFLDDFRRSIDPRYFGSSSSQPPPDAED